jgi:plasmid stabilization system protein ParE
MRLIVRLAAELDIQDAYDWYESQRAGLGGEFLAALTSTRDRVLDYPYSYPVLHRDVRRVLLPRRFPYGLFYRIEGDAVIVVACMHARRDPRSWQRRN